jgi:hypothetical protein
VCPESLTAELMVDERLIGLLPMARLDKASQLIEGAVGLGRLRLCSEVFSQVVFEQRYEVSLRIAVVGQLLTLAN